jgi:hypothetical protein
MESNTMTVKTPYGNVYGIETLEEAERILAKTEAEPNHEDCEECRGQRYKQVQQLGGVPMAPLHGEALLDFFRGERR